MHPPWRKGFRYFFADVGPAPPGMTLDRFPNNDGNYEPGNVRWATQRQQTRNTRANQKVPYRGQTLCLSEWAEQSGIPYKTFHRRLTNLGWSFEKALTTPVRPCRAV